MLAGLLLNQPVAVHGYAGKRIVWHDHSPKRIKEWEKVEKTAFAKFRRRKFAIIYPEVIIDDYYDEEDALVVLYLIMNGGR